MDRWICLDVIPQSFFTIVVLVSVTVALILFMKFGR